MLRESVILVRSKMIMDQLLLVSVIIGVQSHFENPDKFLFFSSFLLVVFSNIITWIICAKAFGLYRDLRQIPFSVEWVVFLKAFGLYALVTSFIAFQIFKQYPYNPHQFLLQCILLFFMIPTGKVLIRVLFKKYRNSSNIQRKVLIVGAGETGLHFYNNYVRNRHYGYQLTGFVDDQLQPSLNGHYLGKTSEIESVIASHELDDIVVTLPINNDAEISHIVNIAERQGKRVRIIPNYQQFNSANLQVDKLGRLSVITLRSLPLDGIDNKIYKRTFDILFSLLVIVLILSWVVPIISLLIKITSKGPILFKQSRWGLNNKTIICYKFRSMIVASRDVDEQGKYLQASKDDPRITSLGKFLRKTNLDELPQFINVLLGSMSIVGPRPHPVPLNEFSKDSVEGYMMRHWVKPGITGWAQVNGYRGETKTPYQMQKRVEHDVWYMENWTLWLDLQIIVQTLVNMVKGEKNAY